MHPAAIPAAIAISISTATALLAGCFTLLVALRSHKPAPANRDTTVSILFAVAFALILLNATAAALIAACGMAYAGLLKATLLATAAFAIAGTTGGLFRSLRSGRPIKPKKAVLF